jgi:SAM-dependent methyltransferase
VSDAGAAIDTTDEAAHRDARLAYWDRIARLNERGEGLGRYYRRRLATVYRNLIPPGQRVLDLGCGPGDLLAELRPAVGVGVDLSPEMVRRATERHPALRFVCGDAGRLPIDAVGVGEPFDYVLLSDLVGELWDVQGALERLRPLCGPHTRLVGNNYSRLWEWPLALLRRGGVLRPAEPQNWLSVGDLRGMATLAGFEVLREWQEVLWPLPTPALGPLLNRVAVRLWPLNHLALCNLWLARPAPAASSDASPSVSVVVPARNEAGNVEAIFRRTPDMGRSTELIFVEGGSTDGTYEAIEAAIAAHPQRRCRLLRQAGTGKGDAVRAGFAAATGDVLMILDADLTVRPEDLPRFHRAIASGTAEFVNGVRLVYPLPGGSMRLANLVGNRFFGALFTWLLGQPIRDTLCGTKVLWRHDYERLAANRGHFGELDPFGDFDLLFGAARLNLKRVDLPVRYGPRVYGQTNIQRWRHGLLLLRMAAVAARRIKFT